MPGDDEIQQTLKRHFEAWNARDRDTWLSLWEADVRIEDPVGGPEKRGLAAVEETWNTAFQDGQVWTMNPVFVRICGAEAALLGRSVGHVNGQEVVIESIEFWAFGPTAKVSRLRTFFETPGGVELDPYFSKLHAE
jgi:hypothetical protein